jgi:hypothetical protein
MFKSYLFWGILLIVFGILFGLQTAGLITQPIWGYLWGIFLIFLGVWIIWGISRKPNFDKGERVRVGLGTAKQARVKIDFGAGAMQLSGGASAEQFLEGIVGAGLEVKSDIFGDSLNVKVDAGPSFLPFLGPDGGSWMFRLNESLPITIEVNSGASSTNFDLSNLKVTELEYQTGASSNKLVLPANAGKTAVKIEGGASSFDVTVPDGVAAKIVIKQGATAVRVNDKRFTQSGSDYYKSPDFETAANQVEILINLGAGSIDIR